jgi:plasmid stability protein
VSNLQVKNVPDDLYREIRRQAKRQGRTIRDLVLEAVRREIAREEFRARLQTRRPVELGRRAADALDEERTARDRELET